MAEDLEKRITAKMVLDSTGFNEGLKGVNQQLRLNQSELKNIGAGIQAFGKDTEKLKSLQESLGKEIELQSKKVGIYKDSIEKTTSKMQENIKARDELKQKLDQEKAKYNEVIKLYGKESSEAEKAKESLDKLTEEYKKKERAVESNAKAINNYTTNMNKAEAGLTKVKGELSKVNQELEEQENKWIGTSNALKEHSENLKSVGEKASSAGDSILKMTAPLVGAGIAAGNVEIQFQKSMGKIQAATGATTEEMKEYESTVAEVTKTGAGNFEEVSNAIVLVQRNMKGIPKDIMPTISEQAIRLSELMEADVGQTTRAAGMLMKQFGIDGQTSLDLIAKGYQSGIDFSGEMLDTLIEYSPQFKAMGFSAENMFNQLIKGAQAGAWNLDKVGDAIKEFNIRTKDGSKSTAEAFSSLGLSAEKMGEDFAKGGDKAQAAFMATMAALSKVDDEQKRNQIGVQLFGTMYEDLEKDVIASLGNMEDKLGDYHGTAQEVNDSLKSSTEDMMGSIEVASEKVGKVVAPMITSVADSVGNMADKFSQLNPETQETIVKSVGLAVALGGVLKVGGNVATSVGNIIGIMSKLSGVMGTAAIATEGVGTAATVAAGTAGVGGVAGLGASLGGLAVAAAPWLLAGAAVAGTGYMIYKGMTEEAVPAVDLFADKVTQTAIQVKDANGAMTYGIQEDTVKISEATQKSVGAYMELDNSAKQSLTDLYVNGTAITDQTVTTLVGKYNDMGVQIKAGMDKHYADELNTMQTFFQSSKALSDTEEANALASLKKNNDDKKAETDNYTKQIQDILKKASDEKRSLTLEEQQKINSIQETMRTNAVKSLSDSEVESKIILERLKEYGTRITTEQASEMIKNANKARDGSVKAANDQYNKTVAEIIRMRDETGSITAEQADKLIADATRQKEESITKANEMKDGVVQKIKGMNSDIEDSVDTSSGKILNMWDKLKNWWDGWTPSIKSFSYSVSGSADGMRDLRNNWTGNPSFEGGFTTLHERGYEIYDLPRSTRIYNHDASQDLVLKTAESVATKVAEGALSRFSGGTNGINVIQNIYTPVARPSEVARQSKNNLRELSLLL